MAGVSTKREDFIVKSSRELFQRADISKSRSSVVWCVDTLWYYLEKEEHKKEESIVVD